MLRATRLKQIMLTLVDIDNFSLKSGDRYICSLLIRNQQLKVEMVSIEPDEITEQ